MLAKQKILVIEDEHAIQRFVQINLERNGFEVSLASTGEEGMQLVRTVHPQLVVLDVMLPDTDGFRICQQIRQSYPQLAVIMLTARGEDMDRVMGLELGADDYMVKPFNPLELVARIRSVLRRTVFDKKEPENTLVSGPGEKITLVI